MSQYPGRNVRIELSVEQLQANIRFLEDQIFRVKFIDPKIPGNRTNLEHINAAESALAVMQEALKTCSGPKPEYGNQHQLPTKSGAPDFHKPVQASRARGA